MKSLDSGLSYISRDLNAHRIRNLQAGGCGLSSVSGSGAAALVGISDGRP